MHPISKEIGAIFIPVSNIEKARDWYTELLGLHTEGEILYDHLFVIPMGTTNIVLDSKISRLENRINTPLFHFNTDNIESAFNYVKQKGIELTTEIEHGHWFCFKDPDGNHLMICAC